MYSFTYFSPFLLLRLVRDRHIVNTEDVSRPLVRSLGYVHTVHLQMQRSLAGFEELGLITIDGRGYIEPTNKLTKFLEVFDLGLTKMSEYGPDSLLIRPMFGWPDPPRASPDVFVLMPFEDDLRPVYEDHIKKVVGSHGLTVGRADDFFSSGSIVNEIWSAINAAKVIIADCTGRNPNVFYEIGLAHTLGKPVVLTSQAIRDVPFDLRHLRFIPYEFNPRGMEAFEQALAETLRTQLYRPRSAERIIEKIDRWREQRPEKELKQRSRPAMLVKCVTFRYTQHS